MQESTSQKSRIVLLYAAFVFFPAGGMMYQLANCAPLRINPLRPIPVGDSAPGFESDAVRLVSTMRDWELATSTGRCILFIDGPWNIESAMFHTPYSEFAEWNRNHSDIRTIVVILDSNERDALWHAVGEMQKANSMQPGGMKRLNGATRVVWFQDGRVVDYDWCYSVLEVNKLKSRTEAAYSSF